MAIKNYTTIDLGNLAQMKVAANEIATETNLAHGSSVSLARLNEAKTPGAAQRHFKAVVQTYYRVTAEAWLDANGIEALPAEFDEWADMAGAARAHILMVAGIQIVLHNGWATTDTWL